MTVDITPENVARRVEDIRRASGRFDILDCETALQVADLAEALAARVAELEAERDAAREALMNAGISLHVAKREAEAAEAEVERLREALSEAHKVAAIVNKYR